MAEHLLTEGYKDASGVMIGSVLEKHLRLLAANNSIDVTYIKPNGDIASKKAEVLNADLKKAGVYGPLEQKQVISWLGLRNSAAHGHYDEYNNSQVKLMYQSVLDFISRVN